ncbi:hypothetical protein QZH41_005281 [Actinostola sp. cb2023]|nr:hypothetical protein QZH41_005281 [Actinostola sp. cb2023]
MASYMIEIFGDKMHRIPVNKSMGEFPSPEFFKYKILIRGKVDTADTVDDAKDTNGVKSNLEQESEKAKKNENEDELKEKRNSIVEVTSSSDGHMDVPAGTASTSELAAPTSPSTRSRGLIFSDSKKKVAKELSKLINYISNSKFISFEESAKNGKFWQSSSFVEGDMESYADKNAAAFINFNRRQLSRIYPGGMRIDSSNYNPIKAWNVGSQIVALNHQTNDEPMALYYGKFRQNGKAGYVLKPAFLRDPSIKFNPNSITKPTIGSKVLKMTIISGQQLPEEPDSWAFAKDVPDPYVLVQVYGVPADEFIFTTSTHYDNSFNPTWNESFETKILVPELAMIKFSVYDKDIGFDDFIGQSTLPFESLQQGYRHVPLLDKEGVAIPCASIFIHVLCEELVQNSQHKDQSN